MGSKKMGKIKIIIVILSVLLVGVLIAGTPTRTTQSTNTKLMSAGAWDTVTVAGVVMDGDSIGFALNFNQDSVAGYIVYQYITQAGNTSTEFASADTLALSDGSKSFTCTGNVKAVFTSKVPTIAGAYDYNLYIMLKNNKTSAVTLTTTIHKVRWR